MSRLPAQTTSGIITGTVADPSGAIVSDAQIDAVNQGTGVHRTATSGANGIYNLLQLEPGIYSLTVTKPGFAQVEQSDVRLQVNQSLTLDFKMTVATVAQTVHVTGLPPALNTTSATVSTVIGHTEAVQLPLNGREFTQLALLAPGASPVENGQQGAFIVKLGAGGISPSMNGQRGEQNNFTMDGILNNEIFVNTWVIAPPPDAIQEFNVQSHITNAQFAISSGANINVVTRSGTNTFHGDLWEFLRNDALDANTYPDVTHLPYHQNQYGLFLGGPVTIPKLYNGKDSTWFSFYWEGFRSKQTSTQLASVPTAAMRAGNFSGILGPQIGLDDQGRPQFTNQIYDPETSIPDPGHPGLSIRNPFPNNTIPTNRLNGASLLYLQKYYPLPNLNVPEGDFPNYQFPGPSTTSSDVFGIRLDHHFKDDSLFMRFNRSKQVFLSPEGLPTYRHELINYAQQAAFGDTHMFNPSTLLDLHVGYSYMNYFAGDTPAGSGFASSVNSVQAFPAHGGIQLVPGLGISNGFTGTSQFAVPLGPMEAFDYHLNFTKVVKNHTIGVGALYYHLRALDDGWVAGASFTQNGTSENGAAGPTGYGAGSFLLGALHGYSPWLGETSADQTVNWWGLYAQDTWQVTPKLVLHAGMRWDYIAPPNYHKVVSGLDVLTGKFIVTGAVPGFFDKATGPSGYFNPQYNGWEPRFGLTYHAWNTGVVHAAFAILDDHNNNLIQGNQGIRLSWPSGIAANITSLDLGKPTTYLDKLPAASTLFGPGIPPYASYGADPNNKIPYTMEFNMGVQQQLSSSTSLKLNYVGSLGRHQYIVPEANTAVTPGPGPIAARQPFPQYGGPFSFEWMEMPTSYNALQAELNKQLSNGILLHVSYTYSKSMDWQSDPYNNDEEDFYNLKRDWGPSDFNKKHMFVLSGVYELPFGKDRHYLSNTNKFVDRAIGGWMLGAIATLNSGAPFNVYASGDVANTGSPGQRAQRTGVAPYGGTGFKQNRNSWINAAAFSNPAPFTFGNEGRNDLVGPRFTDFDFNLSKTFPVYKTSTLQFRSEFFNIFNHTNLGNPGNTIGSSSLGKITGAAGTGRQIQFALKLAF
ncbi:MAG: TonB-dependent receptor [Acidobacteriaceae bacterium]